MPCDPGRLWPVGEVLDRGSTAACPPEGTPVTGRSRVSVLEGGRQRSTEHLNNSARRDSCAGFIPCMTPIACPDSGRRRIYTADGGIICQQDGSYWHSAQTARLLGGSDRSRDYWRVMLFDLCSCDMGGTDQQVQAQKQHPLVRGCVVQARPVLDAAPKAVCWFVRRFLFARPCVLLSSCFCLVQLISKELFWQFSRGENLAVERI